MQIPLIRKCFLAFNYLEDALLADWVLGNRFMNSHCVAYDFGSNQVGFAHSKDHHHKPKRTGE